MIKIKVTPKKIIRYCASAGIIIIAICLAIPHLSDKKATTISQITNVTELSDEFMENFFDKYNEARNDDGSDPANMLIVVSLEEPESHNATRVIEGPNHTYFLQFENTEDKEAAFEALQNSNAISVEENNFNELDSYMSWGIEDMGLDNAISALDTISAPNEVIAAIMDSGINPEVFEYNFPDRTLLTKCIVSCPDGMNDVIGHGTHVSGTVAEGTASNVTILMMKTDTTIISGGEVVRSGIYDTDILASVDYAIYVGADVLNMSLGGAYNPRSDASFRAAFQSAVDAGIISIAASGNDALKGNPVSYPAAYETTISIGAVDENRDIANFSTHNDYVDFVAPGVNIWSLNYTNPTGRLRANGTSMATPHMTAMVANLKGFNKDLSIYEARELMKEYAIDLGAPGKDEYYGWGYVDMSEAVFCTTRKHCDQYGIMVDPSFVENHAPEIISFTTDGETITVTADRACTILQTTDGNNFKFLTATPTEEENTYTFTATDELNEKVHLYVAGDMTMNGIVNSSDALAIAKYIGNTESFNNAQIKLGDTNRNGLTNSSDALSIAKDYKGLQSLSW
jgi:hypothetical protein